MLIGLSVHDGSMSGSVHWRRVWWKFAGAGLLAVGAGLIAIAVGAWGHREFITLTIAAFAASIEGVRLLRRNRKSPGNLRLHRWSIGAWLIAAMVVSPILSIPLLPALTRRGKGTDS